MTAEFENRFAGVGSDRLADVIRRLRRAEEDLMVRVARRAAQLKSACLRLSDPLYQRLFFIHRDLKEQVAAAETELARRRGTRNSVEACA